MLEYHGSQSRKAIIRGLERCRCANWDSRREPENRVNNHQDEHTDGHDHGTVGVPVHVPGDGGEVRGHGGVVHGGALEAVHRGVDEGRDEGEEIGQDAHRSGDLPVDVLAGDEWEKPYSAPEPVGDLTNVHGISTGIRFFNPTTFQGTPPIFRRKFNPLSWKNAAETFR